MHNSSNKPFFTIQTYEDRNNAINRELNQKVSERLSVPTSLQATQREEAPQDKPPSTSSNTASAKVPPATPLRTSASSCNNGLNTDSVGDNIPTASTTTTSAMVHAPPPPPFPIRHSPRPLSTPVTLNPSNTNPLTLSHPVTNGFYSTNGTTSNNGTIRSKTKAPPPPVPIKTSVLSHLQAPPCPTPDYDTLSLSSNNATLNRNGKLGTATSQQQQQKGLHNDAVEMESLDSFKLNKPYDATPRPPNNYFKSKQNGIVQNGNAHIMTNGVQERKPRPVSVTIGEYPSGTTRKAPGKLDFLQRDDTDGKRNGNTQFANELAMTLTRSNLRKRTESMANCN